MTLNRKSAGGDARLDDIVIFVRVVQNGSLSMAAKQLGKSPSHISKHLTALETALGVSLLQRSTHHLQLTDAGGIFFDHCLRILSDLEAAKADAGAVSDELIGTLRIHSTPGIGQALIVQTSAEYTRKFPNIRVELNFSIYSAGLNESGADIVIGSRDFDKDKFFASGVFERKLGSVPHVICATPAYLARHGHPRVPQDLLAHNCLIHVKQRGSPALWTMRHGDQDLELMVDGSFRSNIESAIRLAAIEGTGIARLPRYNVADELRQGTLIALLENCILPERTIKAFYPRSRFVPRKVYEFLALLEDRIQRLAA